MSPLRKLRAPPITEKNEREVLEDVTRKLDEIIDRLMIIEERIER